MQQMNLDRREVLLREQIQMGTRYCFLKRIMDIVCSLTGLIALLPVFAIVVLAIKLESKGPIFFSQKRVGEKWTNI